MKREKLCGWNKTTSDELGLHQQDFSALLRQDICASYFIIYSLVSINCQPFKHRKNKTPSSTRALALRSSGQTLEPGWEAAWTCGGTSPPGCPRFWSWPGPREDCCTMLRWPSRSLKGSLGWLSDSSLNVDNHRVHVEEAECNHSWMQENWACVEVKLLLNAPPCWKANRLMSKSYQSCWAGHLLTFCAFPQIKLLSKPNVQII